MTTEQKHAAIVAALARSGFTVRRGAGWQLVIKRDQQKARAA